MNTALRIILATTRAQDASAANAAHGEALAMNAQIDHAKCDEILNDAILRKLKTAGVPIGMHPGDVADMRALGINPADYADPDDLARCTATAAECLADGRDALMDADADNWELVDEGVAQGEAFEIAMGDIALPDSDDPLHDAFLFDAGWFAGMQYAKEKAECAA